MIRSGKHYGWSDRLNRSRLLTAATDGSLAGVTFHYRTPKGVLAMPISDVVSDEELKRRYDALPHFEELPGEWTYLSRCGTWELFIERAHLVAKGFSSNHDDDRLRQRNYAPDLYDLIVEAFPG